MSWFLEPTFIFLVCIASFLLGMASALCNRSAFVLLVTVFINAVAISVVGGIRHEPLQTVIPAELAGFVVVQIGYFAALFLLKALSPEPKPKKVENSKTPTL